MKNCFDRRPSITEDFMGSRFEDTAEIAFHRVKFSCGRRAFFKKVAGQRSFPLFTLQIPMS